MRRRHPSPFVSRLFRLLVRGTEIGPDHPGELDRRIRFQPDTFSHAGLLALRRQVHALTRHVVFPSVIRTADSALLIAAEPEAHSPVGAELIDQAEPALRIAKRKAGSA